MAAEVVSVFADDMQWLFLAAALLFPASCRALSTDPPGELQTLISYYRVQIWSQSCFVLTLSKMRFGGDERELLRAPGPRVRMGSSPD